MINQKSSSILFVEEMIKNKELDLELLCIQIFKKNFFKNITEIDKRIKKQMDKAYPSIFV